MRTFRFRLGSSFIILTHSQVDQPHNYIGKGIMGSILGILVYATKEDVTAILWR